MHLCLWTFANVLEDNRQNSSIIRASIGEKLLTFIDPAYYSSPGIAYDPDLGYKYLGKNRNLPRRLVEMKLNIETLHRDFQKYVDECLCLDHDKIFHDFISLIKNDSGLPPSVKNDLLEKANPTNNNLPMFLAELFIFVVKHTKNKQTGKKSSFPNLQELESEHHAEKSLPQPLDAEVEERPYTYHNLPHRNACFMNSYNILEEIKNRLEKNHASALTHPKTLILYGLSGVGKSEAAIEYAHENLGGNGYDVVLRVMAKTKDLLTKNIKDFLHAMKVECNSNDDEIIRREFLAWFVGNANWLLIFDNVYDPDLIEDYVPKSNKGHVLFTTQLTNLPSWLSDEEIHVKCFELKTAMDFLAKRSNVNADTDAEELVDRLGYHPLALEQACVRMGTKRPDCDALISQLEKRGLKIFESCNIGVEKKNILTTWLPTIEKIHHPSARHLLSVFAFMHPLIGKIDNLWLQIADHDVLKTFANDMRMLDSFHKIVHELIKYSLVQPTISGKLYMNPLLQEVVRNNAEFGDILLRATWNSFFPMALSHCRSGAHYNDPYHDMFMSECYDHIRVLCKHMREITNKTRSKEDFFRLGLYYSIMGLINARRTFLHKKYLEHTIGTLSISSRMFEDSNWAENPHSSRIKAVLTVQNNINAEIKVFEAKTKGFEAKTKSKNGPLLRLSGEIIRDFEFAIHYLERDVRKGTGEQTPNEA